MDALTQKKLAEAKEHISNAEKRFLLFSTMLYLDNENLAFIIKFNIV
jgi:hypothetical protein